MNPLLILSVVAVLVSAGIFVWAISLRRRLVRKDDRRTQRVSSSPEGLLEGLAEPETFVRVAVAALEPGRAAFFRIAEDGSIRYANPGGRALAGRLGLDGRALDGTSLLSILEGEELIPVRVSIAETLGEGAVRTLEARWDAAGSWYKFNSVPDGDGASVLIQEVPLIRESKQAQRDLEARIRTMVEHSPEALWVVDLEAGSVVDFNQRAVDLFRRSEEELSRTLPYQYSPEHQPDGRRSLDAARAYLEQAARGENPVFEWVHLSRDGEEILTEIRLSRIPHSDRTLIQATVRDITSHRRAESALRESEERYRAHFEQDVSGNFVAEPDGTITAANPAFAEIFGLDAPADALGHQLSSLLTDADHEQDPVASVRSEGSVDFLETVGRTLDGRRVHLLLNARAIHDEDGRIVELRGHVLDMSEQRMLEEQLQQAQRMEAVGRLAGGIAHDFNNLLTTVTGHSDLLLADPRLPGELRDDLFKIKKAAERAGRLTGQLVAFSRKERSESILVDLATVVEDVAEILARVIGEDIALRMETDPDLWPVRGDPGQFEQVVMNLALNARDAMPRGGSLVIRTLNRDMTDESARPADMDPGPYVVLEVADTGEGISKDRLHRIFEPFYTTKGPGKGSGLGLAMVYGIVRQGGGNVQVSSAVGEGTTFSVYVPAVRSRQDDATALLSGPDAPMTEDEEAPGDRTTVLLLQHDPAVRVAVRRILEREGLSVLEADDPSDAASFCREWQGPIAAVISDLLSDVDERLLRRSLDTARPETPVLWTWEGETESAPRVGVREGVLRKPFTASSLIQGLRELVSFESAEVVAGDRSS